MYKKHIFSDPQWLSFFCVGEPHNHNDACRIGRKRMQGTDYEELLHCVATDVEDATDKDNQHLARRIFTGTNFMEMMLPNEILCQILLEHLPPMWQIVSKSVCRRWYHLLQSANPEPASSHGPDQYWFAGVAAHGGHLKILEWARSQGCSWNESTCAHAAEGGHLEILQWLRSQGCPWDTWTCARAVHVGCVGKCYNGYTVMVVHGMSKHAPKLPKEAIWRSYNGPEAKVVPGIIQHAPTLS